MKKFNKGQRMKQFIKTELINYNGIECGIHIREIQSDLKGYYKFESYIDSASDMYIYTYLKIKNYLCV